MMAREVIELIEVGLELERLGNDVRGLKELQALQRRADANGSRLTDGVTTVDARLLDGIAFAEEFAQRAVPIWGEGDQVLWSKGEPFMPYGSQGVIKTTLGQRLTLGRAGIDDMLLALPVACDYRVIVYVAADRPKQAARSWRRMVAQLNEEQRALVRERVRF
jgi:hypothetical protein